MSRQAGVADRLHVLYLGSSADLGALRRSLEAHGAVTRTRLTPEVAVVVAVVVADTTVAADHPTLRAAATLDVRVLDAAQTIDQLARKPSRPDSGGLGQAGFSPSGGSVIAGTIAVLVTVLTLLAVLGAVLRPDEISQRIPLPADSSLPVVVPERVAPS